MILAIENVSKYYGDIKAIDSVSLCLKEGEVLGLVGPNGSGKSTLLRIMLGIVKASSGRILLRGNELAEKDWRSLRGRTGYMPERISFYDNLTGRETLQFFAKIKGCTLDRMQHILRRVLPDDAINRKVGGYSKGMRQRLNLAQSLLNDHVLLILDEPTSGLDPMGTKEFYDILNEVKNRRKHTVILSSHILAEIEDKIDRIAILKNGVLSAVGTLEELYTGLKLPLRISIAVSKRDEMFEKLLKEQGASDIEYKDGHIFASMPRENKLRILSAILQRQNGFTDLSIREPNLEEVFFGVH